MTACFFEEETENLINTMDREIDFLCPWVCLPPSGIEAWAQHPRTVPPGMFTEEFPGGGELALLGAVPQMPHLLIITKLLLWNNNTEQMKWNDHINKHLLSSYARHFSFYTSHNM